jgi:hypothetical protein
MNNIEHLKKANPKGILLIENDEDAIKLLATFDIGFLSYPNNKKEIDVNDNLFDIWKKIDIDIRTWAHVSGVKVTEARKKFDIFVANKIIYPDGSVSENIEKYIRLLSAVKSSRAVHDLSRYNSCIRCKKKTNVLRLIKAELGDFKIEGKDNLFTLIDEAINI